MQFTQLIPLAIVQNLTIMFEIQSLHWFTGELQKRNFFKGSSFQSVTTDLVNEKTTQFTQHVPDDSSPVLGPNRPNNSCLELINPKNEADNLPKLRVAVHE